MRSRSPNLLKTSGRRFQTCDFENNMASNAGGQRGGCRINSGRRKIFSSTSIRKSVWEKSRRRIRLHETIYKSWLEAKYLAGYTGSESDSVFAAHLLSLEYRRRLVYYSQFLVICYAIVKLHTMILQRLITILGHRKKSVKHVHAAPFIHSISCVREHTWQWKSPKSYITSPLKVHQVGFVKHKHFENYKNVAFEFSLDFIYTGPSTSTPVKISGTIQALTESPIQAMDVANPQRNYLSWNKSDTSKM